MSSPQIPPPGVTPPQGGNIPVSGAPQGKKTTNVSATKNLSTTSSIEQKKDSDKGMSVKGFDPANPTLPSPPTVDSAKLTKGLASKWLDSSTKVDIMFSLIEVARALMQNKNLERAIKTTSMKMIWELGKDIANLAKEIRDKEAAMHQLNAVASFTQAGISFASAGMMLSARALAKRQAKSRMNKLNKRQAELENKMGQNLTTKGGTKPPQSINTQNVKPPVPPKEPPPNATAQQKAQYKAEMKQYQKDKQLFQTDKQAYAKKQEQYRAEYKRNQKEIETLKDPRTINEKAHETVQVVNMISQGLNQTVTGVQELVTAGIKGELGVLEREKKILETQENLWNTTMRGADDIWGSDSTKINELLRALEQYQQSITQYMRYTTA